MATCSAMPGRRTFTATSRPSCSTPRCTTAIDADANASPSKEAKVASSGRPVVASMAERTTSKGTCGPVSSVPRNSSATAAPNAPGDDPIS
jgi:hypothetical protein